VTHLRIWKFRPPAGREREFARAYGKDGDWAALFAAAEGFVGTSLLEPAEPGGWWLTIDRWASAAHFEAFQAGFGDRYRALDAELARVAGEEQFVGAFEGED
jgi:heme-degrading monooxygenase HmoA